MAELTEPEAWELLCEYTKGPALRKHARQVEACMQAMAKHFGQPEEPWEIAGMLHDLDYEMYPDQHCLKAKEIMEERGIDPVYIRAMLCHAWGDRTDEKPETEMEKSLFTVDELSGLINATCLVYPSKSIDDCTRKSVIKKFKDKHFSAKIDRDHILQGCQMLGMPLEEVVDICIEGMKENKEACGF